MFVKHPLLPNSLIVSLALIMAVVRVTAQTFTTLHNLSYDSDGAYPQAALILSGNTLYGTAGFGSSSGAGTIFALNMDGTGFKILHTFSAGDYDSTGYYTNSDGAYPLTGLILSGSSLYGTTREGGTSGVGTVFKISTDGTGFTNLHSFNTPAYDVPYINS